MGVSQKSSGTLVYLQGSALSPRYLSLSFHGSYLGRETMCAFFISSHTAEKASKHMTYYNINACPSVQQRMCNSGTRAQECQSAGVGEGHSSPAGSFSF